MTDLSYTNKDGVNLYEGFDNGFNYHRDGAAEGDGYAHGGYPEITGETSDYTDTSYRTGDDPDFFDNGNVWVQPSVGPEPEPVVAPESIAVDSVNKYYATGEKLSGQIALVATYSDESKKLIAQDYEGTEVGHTYTAEEFTQITDYYFEDESITEVDVVDSITFSPVAIGETIFPTDPATEEGQVVTETVTYLGKTTTFDAEWYDSGR